MVSSTPDGNGFPIGLMPGALPSDHASRQTLNTTAVRLPLGHTQFTGFVILRRAPRCRHPHIRFHAADGAVPSMKRGRPELRRNLHVFEVARLVVDADFRRR